MNLSIHEECNLSKKTFKNNKMKRNLSIYKDCRNLVKKTVKVNKMKRSKHLVKSVKYKKKLKELCQTIKYDKMKRSKVNPRLILN